MSKVDETLIQNSKDFFDTIFSEVFRISNGEPISADLYNEAIDAMGIEGEDLNEFHDLYDTVEKLPDGRITRDALMDAIIVKFTPQKYSGDELSPNVISGFSDASSGSVKLLTPAKDSGSVSGFFRANYARLTDSGDFELDMSGLRRKMGFNLGLLTDNDSFE